MCNNNLSVRATSFGCDLSLEFYPKQIHKKEQVMMTTKSVSCITFYNQNSSHNDNITTKLINDRNASYFPEYRQSPNCE